ncbi:MAG: zf-TFIIB domain-containing protein [Myxococcaceae bacterium]
MSKTCPACGGELRPSQPGEGVGRESFTCAKCSGVSVSGDTTRKLLGELGFDLKQFAQTLDKAKRSSTRPLKCPRCQQGCVAIDAKGVELDVCKECGGTWFDGGELFRVTGGKLGARADGPGPKIGGAVGSKASTGRDSTEEIVGVFEMWWDCAYCGTAKLLGVTNRFCPNCSAPQDATRRYFPPAGQEQAVNLTFEGADKQCPNCQTPNGAKANACRQCGAPLDEAARVKLQADQDKRNAVVAQQQKAQPKKGMSGIAKAAIGVGAMFLMLIVVCVSWKKEVSVTVKGHHWSRSIDIEALNPKSESAWCDSTPGDAYSIRREREQRSTKQIPDGQTCHTKNVDRGNGSFEKREVCETKYRSEPVYDYKCYYTVDRWQRERSVEAGGTLSQSPSWPSLPSMHTGNCRGCEREGPHHEEYVVELDSSEGKHYKCDKNEQMWRALGEGSKFPMKVRVMTDGADCDSLHP